METPAPHTDTTPLAHADTVVLDYLAALWAASDDLDPEMRDDLMRTAADYIAQRRTAAAPISDPRRIVHRLGPPDALVASVRRGRMPAHLRLPVAPLPRPRAPEPRPQPGTEAMGVVLMTAGAIVLPVVSPIAGMVLISASPRWSVAQKAAAWVLVTGSFLAAFVMAGLAGSATGSGSAALIAAWLTMVTGSVVAGLSLLPGLVSRR